MAEKYVKPLLEGPAAGAAEPGDDDAEDPSATATVSAAAAAGAEDRRALGDEGSDEREQEGSIRRRMHNHCPFLCQSESD